MACLSPLSLSVCTLWACDTWRLSYPWILRQKYWVCCRFLLQGDLRARDQTCICSCPALQVESLPLGHLESPFGRWQVTKNLDEIKLMRSEIYWSQNWKYRDRLKGQRHVWTQGFSILPSPLQFGTVIGISLVGQLYGAQFMLMFLTVC